MSSIGFELQIFGKHCVRMTEIVNASGKMHRKSQDIKAERIVQTTWWELNRLLCSSPKSLANEKQPKSVGSQQECIPVGYVSPAAVTTVNCILGVSVREGVLHNRDMHLPQGQTDASENITFPQLRLGGGVNILSRPRCVDLAWAWYS